MTRIAPAVLLLALSGLCAAQSTPRPENYDPLLEAHQELLLARAMIADQNYDSALTPLREAGRALADFQQLDKGPMGEQAGFIRQDIADYITHVGRDSSVEPIDAWIHKIEQWMGHSKHPVQPPPAY